MQRMHRKIGTYRKGTADAAQIGTMLHEFEEADKMLAKVPVLSSTVRQLKDSAG